MATSFSFIFSNAVSVEKLRLVDKFLVEIQIREREREREIGGSRDKFQDEEDNNGKP